MSMSVIICMSKSVIIIYALMFGAFFGMLWANKQYKAKGVPWGRPLAALFGVTSLVFAVVAMFKAGRGGGIDEAKVREYREREMTYRRIAYKKLGQAVAKAHPKGKILLIKYMDVGTDGEADSAQKAQLEGFKEGLDGQAEIIAEESVSYGGEEAMMMDESESPEMTPEQMMENMLTAKKMDMFISVHKRCNVIVSFAGLPPDYQLMKLWKITDPKQRPSLVLADAWLYELKKAFHPKRTFITAALTDKGTPYDPNKPVPEDEDEAFNMRYLLITPENVEAVHKEHPDLFMSAKAKKK